MTAWLKVSARASGLEGRLGEPRAATPSISVVREEAGRRIVHPRRRFSLLRASR